MFIILFVSFTFGPVLFTFAHFRCASFVSVTAYLHGADDVGGGDPCAHPRLELCVGLQCRAVALGELPHGRRRHHGHQSVAVPAVPRPLAPHHRHKPRRPLQARGSGGGQEGVRRGSGGGQEGIDRSSLDARKPQNRDDKMKNTMGIRGGSEGDQRGVRGEVRGDVTVKSRRP
eukprot:5772606-Pyramimonas_sp.AAC.1